MEELIKISEFMKLSQEDRQKHLDLDTPCGFHTYTKDWGKKKTGDLYGMREQMLEAKRKLLDFHNIEEFNNNKIHVCHKCQNVSTSDKVCINPLHLYFGTASENHLDKPEDIRQKGGKAQGKSNVENGTGSFYQKVECPHCNKEGQLSVMKRWHFENCKNKK